MRLAIGVVVGRIQSHAAQQLQHPLAYRILAQVRIVEPDRTRQVVADRVVGVQGGEGVLEDHLHGAAVARQSPAAAADGLAVEQDLAAGGRLELQQELGDGGLAGAGLSDQRNGLPRHQPE
nr:hypothetical protein [Actinomyces sp. Z16]